MDTKGIRNRDVSSAINGFLATTIWVGHIKKVHHGKMLPKVFIGPKKAKETRKKMDYFNEHIFKTFWEVKGGQLYLSSISSSRFHKKFEALEKDPDFENYNTYVKK